MRPENNSHAVASAVAFCKKEFLNDGAEGESVHLLCDTIALLEKKIRFYESIMHGQPPHHRTSDKPCKIAEKHGVACCNPKCNGNWGTGCWCCHYLEFAAEADQEAIDAHLALLTKPPGIDELNGRVTTAILEAKAAARRASSAHMEVSRIEEEIANALPVSSDEGALARLGVVTAALDAGDAGRDRVAYTRALEKAKQYLVEEEFHEEFVSDIKEIAEEAERKLKELGPA